MADDNLKPLFTSADGMGIIRAGREALKKPNPVYILGPQERDFSVQTNEGRLDGHAGDYVAHDPISGHVWPLAASYFAQHYYFVKYEEDEPKEERHLQAVQ
jgi:hypothetical protein